MPAVIVWAIAFAFVESAVVEYLRALYYPLDRGGFQFPLLSLEDIIALGEEHRRRLVIELGREFSTLVMLATIGIAAARNCREAWAHFMIAFGVWDIFYYIWLKIFINWPSSLTTWDLLFLIPVPWISPVLAPVIISLVMILAGIVVLVCEAKGQPLDVGWLHWAAFGSGGVLVMVSFCWDYRNVMNGGLPNPFNWPVFFAGLILAASAFLAVLARHRP
jgi:hypothetical protein